MADKIDTSKRDVFVYIYDAADDEDEAHNQKSITQHPSPFAWARGPIY